MGRWEGVGGRRKEDNRGEGGGRQEYPPNNITTLKRWIETNSGFLSYSKFCLKLKIIKTFAGEFLSRSD